MYFRGVWQLQLALYNHLYSCHNSISYFSTMTVHFICGSCRQSFLLCVRWLLMISVPWSTLRDSIRSLLRRVKPVRYASTHVGRSLFSVCSHTFADSNLCPSHTKRVLRQHATPTGCNLCWLAQTRLDSAWVRIPCNILSCSVSLALNRVQCSVVKCFALVQWFWFDSAVFLSAVKCIAVQWSIVQLLPCGVLMTSLIIYSHNYS